LSLFDSNTMTTEGVVIGSLPVSYHLPLYLMRFAGSHFQPIAL